MGKQWKLKEINDSKVLGGNLTRGSGNQWYEGGDIRTEHFLVESKYTGKKSYSITKNNWNKISNEALMSYRFPMMSIRIQDLDLIVIERGDWVKILGGIDVPPHDKG